MKEVVKRILGGDRDAFRAIVVEYGAIVRAFLGSHLMDPSVVDDLGQQTFIVAFEKLGEFDFSSDMASWLRGIARNELLMHLRRAQQHGKAMERIRSEILKEACDGVCRASGRDNPSTLEKLRQCLTRLPENARTVIEARHLGHEKVASMAVRLQTSTVAVSSLLFRARKLLRQCMETGG